MKWSYLEAISKIFPIQGLKATVEVRDETQPLIDGATGSEQCVEAAISNWEAALNNSGSSIASCVRENLVKTLRSIEIINNELNEQHAIIFDVQNLVLDAFSEV